LRLFLVLQGSSVDWACVVALAAGRRRRRRSSARAGRILFGAQDCSPMSRQLQSRKEAAAATRDLLKVDAARVCKLGRWCPEAEARGGSDAEGSGGTGEEGCGGADVAGPRRARVPLCAGIEEFGICFCYSTKILLHGLT
ncbi:unnamed protein product, partial [Urochloa humidicola]